MSYKLKESKGPVGFAMIPDNGVLGDEIHINHTSWENLSDAKDDVWTPFVVVEECTNYPRLHLVCHDNEDEALQVVSDWMNKEHGTEHDMHLITVLTLTL